MNKKIMALIPLTLLILGCVQEAVQDEETETGTEVETEAETEGGTEAETEPETEVKTEAELSEERTVLYQFLNRSGISDAVIDNVNDTLLVRYNLPSGLSREDALKYIILGAASLIPDFKRMVVQFYEDFNFSDETNLTVEEALNLIHQDVTVMTKEELHSQFSMKYNYTSEMDYQEINVHESKLTYTYLDETEETALSESEIDELIESLDSTDFILLEGAYGADESQGTYQHVISFKFGDEEKEVIYQSSLDAPGMPEAFEGVKDRLFELVSEKFDLE